LNWADDAWFAQAVASTVKLYGHEPSVTVTVNTSADGTSNTVFVPAAKVPVETAFPAAFEMV
jgi:hypothetical protein